MALVEANFKANLKTAQKQVAESLGLPLATDGTVNNAALTYSQAVAYNKGLAAKILQYPNSFSPQSVETARLVSAKDYPALQDTSFSFDEFKDALSDSSQSVLASVGRGLVAIAAVGLVAYIAFHFFGESGSKNSPASA